MNFISYGSVGMSNADKETKTAVPQLPPGRARKVHTEFWNFDETLVQITGENVNARENVRIMHIQSP